jgi:hypothetical protein
MPTLSKNPGVIGFPAGIKDKNRVDFKNNRWIQVIESKGYRVAWFQTTQCPCRSVSTQTDQADPNCTLCGGNGWIFFKPVGAVSNPKIIGALDTLQTKISTGGAVIHAVMTGLGNSKRPWETVGPRLEGTSQCTVRAENKLGYYDRIIGLDATLVYAQLILAGDPAALLVTRYPVVSVNLLRSKTQVYALGTDYTVVAGDIQWVTGKGPVAGTPLTCHYLCHPTYRVIEHPHTVRLTYSKFKVEKPSTPMGDPIDLPTQALLRYEWLL